MSMKMSHNGNKYNTLAFFASALQQNNFLSFYKKTNPLKFEYQD